MYYISSRFRMYTYVLCVHMLYARSIYFFSGACEGALRRFCYVSYHFVLWCISSVALHT